MLVLMQKERASLEFTTVNDHGKLAVTPGMIGDRMLPLLWPSFSVIRIEYNSSNNWL